MSITIRHGVPEDVDQLVELERANFSDAWSAREVGNFLKPDSNVVKLTIVAEDEDAEQLVGFIMAVLVSCEAQVYNIVVTPPYRRHGIGTRLLDTALLELGEKGAEEVYLEVRASNTAAQALYAARGFSEKHRRKEYYRQPTEDGLILHKTFFERFSL